MSWSTWPAPLWTGNRTEIYACEKHAIAALVGLATGQPLQEVKVRLNRTDPSDPIHREFLCHCGRGAVLLVRPLWDPATVDKKEGGTR